MSSSFFLKAKPKQAKKRKIPIENIFTKKEVLKPKRNPEEDDDEVHSSDEDELPPNAADNVTFSDEDDNTETPQDKRLKLAKLYLEEIEKEEQSRAEDKEVFDSVSKRLTTEYLDSVGKLRRKVADDYQAVDLEHVRTLKHKLHKLPVTSVCLSTDNKYLFSGNKSHIVLKWDFESLKVVGQIDTRVSSQEKDPAEETKKRRPQIWTMAITTDFKFLAIGDMGPEIHIWCPEKLVHLHTFNGHRDIVTGLVFRKDTHDLYSVSKDRSVKIWSLDEMTYVETLYGHQASITAIDALSRERAISAGGSDCSIRIWKIAEESQLIYNGHKGSIEAIRLINEENFLSSGDDGSLCVWSAMKKKPLCVRPLAHGKAAENGQANWISSITTLINTDIIASGSCDGSIKIWKLGDNYREITLLFEVAVPGFVNSLSFTNDGTKLIAAIGQEHRLGRWWRIKDAKNSIVIVPLLKQSQSEKN